MKIESVKRKGTTTLYVIFEPDTEHEEEFMKILTEVLIEGGKLSVATSEARSATLIWPGEMGTMLVGPERTEH